MTCDCCGAEMRFEAVAYFTTVRRRWVCDVCSDSSVGENWIGEHDAGYVAPDPAIAAACWEPNATWTGDVPGGPRNGERVLVEDVDGVMRVEFFDQGTLRTMLAPLPSQYLLDDARLVDDLVVALGAEA